MGADAVLAIGQAIVALKNLIEKLPYESEYLGRSTITFDAVEVAIKPMWCQITLVARLMSELSSL